MNQAESSAGRAVYARALNCSVAPLYLVLTPASQRLLQLCDRNIKTIVVLLQLGSFIYSLYLSEISFQRNIKFPYS